MYSRSRKSCWSYLCEVVDVEDTRVRHWQSDNGLVVVANPIPYLRSFGTVATVNIESRLSLCREYPFVDQGI